MTNWIMQASELQLSIAMIAFVLIIVIAMAAVETMPDDK